MTWPEVVDTAIKIGLGAVIAAVSSYLLDRARSTTARKLEANRVRQERIIDPVVSFIDELLVPLSQTYWSHMDNLNTARSDVLSIQESIDEKIATLRNKEAVIEARLASLEDESLRGKFSEFSRMYFRVQQALNNREVAKAHDLEREAIKLAGELLNSLYALRV